jgi:F-type H+-transporting ATPase subunit epsilon
MLHLRIITPKKVVLEQDVDSVTAPGADGEFTVLPEHSKLFSLLKEGIVMIKSGKNEDFLAIGSGYLETDGSELTILVARAYGQDEIDVKITEEAIKSAQTLVARALIVVVF